MIDKEQTKFVHLNASNSIVYCKAGTYTPPHLVLLMYLPIMLFSFFIGGFYALLSHGSLATYSYCSFLNSIANAKQYFPEKNINNNIFKLGTNKFI